MSRFLKPLWLLPLILLAGCSIPRVIVLNDPLDAREHNDLGVSYELRGEGDLALREYLKAAKMDRDWALPLVNAGNIHAQHQRWDEAARLYREARERDPVDPQALNNLAWALHCGGDSPQALLLARQSLEISPDCLPCQDTLATIEQSLKASVGKPTPP